MRPLLLILLLSWAYAGCLRAPVETAPPETAALPQPGGVVRVLVSEGWQAEAVLTFNVGAAPWKPERGASSGDGSLPPGGGECISISLDARPGLPGKDEPDPQDIVDAWVRGLRDTRSSHRWLLRPVSGCLDVAEGRRLTAGGLTPRAGGVELCLSRETPDLDQRLVHPALRLLPGSAGDAAHEGLGPFVQTTPGTLQANPAFAGPGPYLESVELVSTPGADASVLFRLGDLDLAVLYGREAAALAASTDLAVSTARLDDWDRVYFLWLESSRRWVNDPTFRRWLAESIDREGLLRYVFDGHGSAATTLSGGAAAAEPPLGGRRPFGSGSRPRLSLGYDRDDAAAGAIAARLQAGLDVLGVELGLHPLAGDELVSGAGGASLSMRLLAHAPRSSDPVLALVDTLSALRPETDSALRLLDQASMTPEPDGRRAGAWLAEDGLLLDRRVVPLVRLDAWLAARVGLRGVTTAPGELGLGGAWWKR